MAGGGKAGDGEAGLLLHELVPVMAPSMSVCVEPARTRCSGRQETELESRAQGSVLTLASCWASQEGPSQTQQQRHPPRHVRLLWNDGPISPLHVRFRNAARATDCTRCQDLATVPGLQQQAGEAVSAAFSSCLQLDTSAGCWKLLTE